MTTERADWAPKAQKIARQGDVWLLRVDSIPDLKIMQTRKNSVVLAQGTAAGNQHIIEGKVFVDTLSDESVYVTIEEENANFYHKEHRPGIMVAPGIYRMKIQQEFVEEEYRNVMD